MKVKMYKTGEEIFVSSSLGVRLIEYGYATKVEAEKPVAEAEKPKKKRAKEVIEDVT